MEEFIQRYQNQRLLEQLNQAYDDLPLTEEVQIRESKRLSHRKLVEAINCAA